MILNRETALPVLQKLLRFDTVQATAESGAPFGDGNRQALTYTLTLLQSLGYQTKDLEGFCGYGEKGSGALFGILGHLDVVPADGDWTHPPFAAEIHDGVLYGRGTLDDKGPLIAALAAFEELLQEGRAPKRRVRFILGCNEESGWRCMDRYFQTEEVPEEGISPDGDFPVIYAEKGVCYHKATLKKPSLLLSFHAGTRANIVPDTATATVKYTEEIERDAEEEHLSASAENGVLTLKTSGKAAHGSRPQDGENAIVKMFRFLGKYDETLAELADKFALANGENLGLKMRDEKSGSLTLNLGIANTMQDSMVLELDIRHPVTVDKDTVTRILEESTLFSVTRGAYHDPLYVDPQDPLIQELLAAYNTVTGQTLKPKAIGGATYARVLPKGVAFGPAEPMYSNPLHEIDECIAVDRFFRLIDIYKEAFRRLLF